MLKHKGKKEEVVVEEVKTPAPPPKPWQENYVPGFYTVDADCREDLVKKLNGLIGYGKTIELVYLEKAERLGVYKAIIRVV